MHAFALADLILDTLNPTVHELRRVRPMTHDDAASRHGREPLTAPA
jgi:hypothetical protein